MPFTVEYLEGPGVVFINTLGEMDYPAYKQQTEEAINLSREHGTGLYLSDVRKLLNRAKMGDVLRINALYDLLGQSRDTRLALVVERNQKDYTLIKIFELSCTVRGWSVRSFLSKDDAIKWLCG